MKKRKIIMQRKLSKDYKILGVGTFFLLIIMVLIIIPYFQEATLILNLENMLDDITLFLTFSTIVFIIVDLLSEIRDYVDITTGLGVVTTFFCVIPHDTKKWDLNISHLILKIPLMILAMTLVYGLIAALTIVVKSKLRRW